MNPIEQNALYILKIMVDENLRRIGGPTIKEKTNLDPRDIDDAIEYLEDLDAVEVLRALGTSPYNFASVGVKSRGKYLYHEIFSDSKRTILDVTKFEKPEVWKKDEETSYKEINTELNYKSLPERPNYPVGSPFGFTEENWEEVSRKIKDKNQLYVVFGLQYHSEYYKTTDLLENIKGYFETAIERFNSEYNQNSIKLNFSKLAAGYGGHVFNVIA